MLVQDILSNFKKAMMEVTERNKVEMLNLSHFIGSLIKQKVMDKKYVKYCIQKLFESMMNRFYEEELSEKKYETLSRFYDILIQFIEKVG